MSVTATRVAKPLGGAPVVLMACVAVLFHGTAQAALPSASVDAPGSPAVGVPAHAPEELEDGQGVYWSLPPVRLGGSLSYGLRRDSSDGLNSMQSGLTTTLNASTNSFIWQPWFARLDAALGFTKMTSSSEGDLPANNSASANVMVTGSGQLSVLSQSKFPFEAHFARDDNRVNTNLAAPSDAASQRYGFTQSYYQAQGAATLGWDRTTQSSADNGSDQQDSLQLRMSHTLENHQLQFSGTRSANRHEKTGESASQDNLSLQHNYTPDPALSVLSMVNVSSADLHLQQGINTTRLAQFSSNVFWREPEQPISVNGGVRAIALDAERAGSTVTFGESSGARMLNANANAGINYEYSRFTRFNAAVNVNSVQNSGLTSTNSIETVGASYQPEGFALGLAQYNWGSSANAFNRSSTEESQRGLVLQLSHSLSQSFKLDGGSTISLSISQGLAAGTTSGNFAPTYGAPLPSQKQLTHSGSASWDMSQQAGAALVRLSVSDSRALDGNQEFFQLINFQASSSLPTSGYSAWTGNLTLQSMRQGKNAIELDVSADGSASTSSSGSLGYQTQRLFGVRNLRFGSDVRLNLQSQQSLRAFQAQQSQLSFLSQLEKRTEHETAAWVNNIDYSIGRTQLRLSAIVLRTNSMRNRVDAGTGISTPSVEERTNRSIYFTLSRRFGEH